MSTVMNSSVLTDLAARLRDSDQGLLKELLPSIVEKAGLALGGLGFLAVSLFAFAPSEFAYRGLIGGAGAASIALSSLIFLTSGAVRNAAEIVGTVRRPMERVDERYQRSMWVAAALAKSSASTDELAAIKRFVAHQKSAIAGRVGFLVGAVELVGLVPLSLAAWWAWRMAGAPVDFAFPEQLLLSVSAGSYAGLVLARYKIETLTRIEFVLSEAIRRKGAVKDDVSLD